MMVSGMGLSRDFAVELLEKKRIIFFFDGLDEISWSVFTNDEPYKIRADFLKDLNLFLEGNQQAIICSSRDEFAAMQKQTSQDAPVSAKIEVLNLTKEAVEKTLQAAAENPQSRTSANHLLNAIENNEFLSQVLRTPFYLTAALEVFDQHDIKEIDLPKDIEKLKSYLLSKYVDKRIYRNTKTLDPAKTRTWLKYLARIIKKKRIVAFELSDLGTEDLKSANPPWWVGYTIMFSLVGAAAGIPVGMLFWLSDLLSRLIAGGIEYMEGEKFIFPLSIFKYPEELLRLLLVLALMGLVSGILAGFFSSLLFGRTIQPRDRAKRNLFLIFTLHPWRTAYYVSRIKGGGFTFIFVLLGILGFIYLLYGVNLIGESFLSRAKGLLLTWLLIILGWRLIAFFYYLYISCTGYPPTAGIKEPYDRFKVGLTRTYVTITILFLLNLLFSTIVHYHPFHITYMDFTGTTAATLFLLTPLLTLFSIFSIPLVKHSVLRLCLYFADAMPLKYVKFLDSAANAGILEKNGGHWRFHNKDLSKYLAE